MSTDIGLYSSHLITEEELAEIIERAGGVVTPEGPYFGRVSEGRAHVWIVIGECYEGVFDHEGNPLDEQGFARLMQARDLLGAEFQTWLSLIISSTSGSQRQAVRFARACCQHCRCVVDNLEGRLFTCTQIEQLYETGGGFTGYGL